MHLAKCEILGFLIDADIELNAITKMTVYLVGVTFLFLAALVLNKLPWPCV